MNNNLLGCARQRALVTNARDGIVYGPNQLCRSVALVERLAFGIGLELPERRFNVQEHSRDRLSGFLAKKLLVEQVEARSKPTCVSMDELAAGAPGRPCRRILME